MARCSRMCFQAETSTGEKTGCFLTWKDTGCFDLMTVLKSGPLRDNSDVNTGVTCGLMMCIPPTAVKCMSVCECVCVFDVPVQPAQQTLCSCDQLNDGSEEVVRGLVGVLPVIAGVLSALRRRVVEVVGRSPHTAHQSLQVVGFNTIILMKESSN